MPRDPIDAREVVRRLGGTARLSQILPYSTQHSIRRAVAEQELRRVSRGIYSLPETEPAYRAAVASSGLVSHTSAAAHWLLDMLNPDTTAHITVPKHGRFRPMRGVQVHFSDVAPADDHDGVTSPLRTAIDCAASLPFADALAIADSALRTELITPEALISAGSRRRGPKSPQVQRVASQADGGAANPFESCLRAIVLDAGLSGFEPQVVLPTSTLSPRVDLANAELQIAIEADSFTYHGSREALLRDCRRYSEIAATGWLLLRFGWEHVMFERDWVASVVVEACTLQASRQKRRWK